MKHLLFGLVFIFFSTTAFAQSVYVPLNSEVYEVIDRYELTQKKFGPFHSSFKPYLRSSTAQFADTLSTVYDSATASSRDLFNIDYLKQDNHEWLADYSGDSKRKLGVVYRKRSDAIYLKNNAGSIHLSPVIDFGGGGESARGGRLFTNTRGLETRGYIDDKVGFYGFFTENQVYFPQFIDDQIVQKTDADGQQRIMRTGVVPGEAFWKRISPNGVDFFTARGYVAFNPTKHIALQFGHDKNFIGNGYRSLILSDFAPSYNFLKLTTNLGPVQYTNLFTQLKANPGYFTNAGTVASEEIGNKYMALHHLSVNILPNLNVGIFEAVVFARDNGQFDITYLNPLIFYRAAEQYLGSPDNMLLGLDFKYIPFRNVMVYGQVNVDEFLSREVFAGNGWWANKQALQGGVKYTNVLGINNLDLQAELNYVRPFMYGHESAFDDYSHYYQPLAHPLGANFMEYVGRARWQVMPRLTLAGTAIYANIGENIQLADGTIINYGNDINRSYLDVKQTNRELGYQVGSGSSASLKYVEFTASYMLRHNLWLDARVVHRNYSSAFAWRNNSTNLVTAGVRLNFFRRALSI